MIFQTLYQDEDVKFWKYYDHSADIWVLSVEVYKWKKSNVMKWLSIIEDVVSGSDGYLFSYVKDAKAKRFNEMFGLQSTGITFKKDGTEYEVMYV